METQGEGLSKGGYGLTFRDEDWEPEPWQDPVWNHPREVRARAFMDKTYRRLNDKRKVIMTNAKVGVDILDKKVKEGEP